MNFEEFIFIERIYIRRRWWQDERNSPPQQNPGGNQRPIFPDDRNPEQAQNVLQIENGGNFELESHQQLMIKLLWSFMLLSV